MTINHEKKLIFIHIPKNAGSSIIKAMGVENIFFDEVIDKYKENYEKYWNKYKKFTVIRDPIDRIISAYKFSRMDESGWFSSTGSEGLNKHMHYDICNSMNINEYINYIYEDRRRLNRWTVPQSWIITNKDGKIEIDFFVRYENLLEDLHQIGINNLEKLNSSEIKNKNLIQLTKKSKILLSEIYEVDYKNFHYKKPISLFLHKYL